MSANSRPDVRAQIATVFHLDKCLGCHTCSVACKNVWTNRPGAECMWWNNVETKPGTGYPTCWEDQDTYRGGWEVSDGTVRLRSTSRVRTVAGIFHHPRMPGVDDYYEPWTYDYERLFSSADERVQPVARPVSLLTGRPMEPEAGPNWDDDLGGSPVYAMHDPNLAVLSAEERRELFSTERLMLAYLPRTCNHCLNPACVAACPSGAFYKRGEDGVVLVDQDRCRGWRSCVAACPYKKTFYNWTAGKSEKCILCFPRVETGEAPACFHSCVGRVRYVGVLLYDAARVADVVRAPRERLLREYLDIVLDPGSPETAVAAKECGVPPAVLESARQSPVYRFVKRWRLALPLHLEFRTLPMLFYVPPLSPLVAGGGDGGAERARIPLRYLAALFGAGDEAPVRHALDKQQAVRAYRRAIGGGELDVTARTALDRAGCSTGEAEEIYRLTALASVRERYVVPPGLRERATEAVERGRR